MLYIMYNIRTGANPGPAGSFPLRAISNSETHLLFRFHTLILVCTIKVKCRRTLFEVRGGLDEARYPSQIRDHIHGRREGPGLRARAVASAPALRMEAG